MEGIARIMSQKGYDTITFDLRGIGRSSGSSTWMCRNELLDVQSIIRYVTETLDRDVFLVGSSAGATLAGAALDTSHRVKGAALIGYVWGFWASFLFGWAYHSIEVCDKPKLFIVGDKDEFTTMSQYRTRISKLPGNINQMKIIEGKNHFQIESSAYDEIVSEWIDDFLRNFVLQSPVQHDKE